MIAHQSSSAWGVGYYFEVDLSCVVCELDLTPAQYRGAGCQASQPGWRYKWLGSHVEMSTSISYGALTTQVCSSSSFPSALTALACPTAFSYSSFSHTPGCMQPRPPSAAGRVLRLVRCLDQLPAGRLLQVCPSHPPLASLSSF